MGIQSAKAADRKQEIKQKIVDYEKDIADRNRVISKQRQEIDFLTLKLKEFKKGANHEPLEQINHCATGNSTFPRYITIHSKQRYKGRTRKANARTIRNDTSKMRKGNPQRISWGLCYAILFLRIRRLLRLEISPVTSGWSSPLLRSISSSLI